MTIEYLSFVCFVGRIHLDHSPSSSSSFMKSSFLIQMIRWIRDSSRIEFFNLLPSFFFSSYETSFFFFLYSTESNHFLLAHIPRIMNPMIMGGHSRWLSPLLHSLLLLLLLQDVMHSGSSHSLAVFSNPSFELCSYIQIA